MRIAVFFTRAVDRLVRPTLAGIMPEAPPGSDRRQRDFERLQHGSVAFAASVSVTVCSTDLINSSRSQPDRSRTGKRRAMAHSRFC